MERGANLSWQLCTMEYGTGAVMGVPAMTNGTLNLLKIWFKYSCGNFPDGQDLKAEDLKEAYTGEGIMINSGEFSNLPNKEDKLDC